MMKTIWILFFSLFFSLSAAEPLSPTEKPTIVHNGVTLIWVGGDRIVCPDGVVRGGKVCTISKYGFWVGGTRAVVCPDGKTIKGGIKCVVAPDGRTWVGID